MTALRAWKKPKPMRINVRNHSKSIKKRFDFNTFFFKRQSYQFFTQMTTKQSGRNQKLTQKDELPYPNLVSKVNLKQVFKNLT